MSGHGALEMLLVIVCAAPLISGGDPDRTLTDVEGTGFSERRVE